MADEFQPQLRLHPMSWLFGVVTFIRQFLLPLLAAALFGSKDGMPSWLGFMIVPMIGAALWKQYFYRYGFGPGGLVIREGVLFKNVRQIDYSRIENIDTQRNVLHRLLRVAEVRVETSTGGKPEALIQVLSMESATALRQTVFAAREERSDRVIEEATEETLLHLPPAEIVRFGLIDNRGMVVVAGLFGLLYEAGFMATLSKPATPARHANVLMHLAGHLKHQLDAADKQELLALIEEQRLGRLPLVVPLTLLAHHARRHDAAYLLGQTYLFPRIEELRLRNRA